VSEEITAPGKILRDSFDSEKKTPVGKKSLRGQAQPLPNEKGAPQDGKTRVSPR